MSIHGFKARRLRGALSLAQRTIRANPTIGVFEQLREDVSTNDLLIRGLASRIEERTHMNMANETPQDVERLLTAKADELRAENPRLTKEGAFDLAVQQNPELYRRHVDAERRVG